MGPTQPLKIHPLPGTRPPLLPPPASILPPAARAIFLRLRCEQLIHLPLKTLQRLAVFLRTKAKLLSMEYVTSRHLHSASLAGLISAHPCRHTLKPQCQGSCAQPPPTQVPCQVGLGGEASLHLNGQRIDKGEIYVCERKLVGRGSSGAMSRGPVSWRRACWCGRLGTISYGAISLL